MKWEKIKMIDNIIDINELGSMKMIWSGMKIIVIA